MVLFEVSVKLKTIMKICKSIRFACAALMAAALVMVSLPGQAQIGFDTFRAPRTAVLTTPQILAAASTTNTTIDLIGSQGIGEITLFCYTNAAAGSVTALIETSPDTNTWTALTYATTTSTSVNYTNTALGNATNVFFTTPWLVPGTFTTPTAATAGFATVYLLSSPMTNTAAVTMTGAQFKKIGFNATDAGRYFRITWTATGSVSTNAIVGAEITVPRHVEVKQ